MNMKKNENEIKTKNTCGYIKKAIKIAGRSSGRIKIMGQICVLARNDSWPHVLPHPHACHLSAWTISG